MARRIGAGGPFLQSQINADNVAIDEDSDWWGGLQLSFVSVPIASAVAALSIAVATAGSFNHQDEVAAKIVGQSEFQNIIPVGDLPIGYAFQNNDETIFTVAPQDNAGEWIQPTPLPPVAIAPLSITQDELFPILIGDDDYQWKAPPPLPSPYLKLFDVQDELTPSVIDEVYNWQAQWIQTYPVGNSWVDSDFVPPPNFIPEEDYWFQLNTDPTEIVVVDYGAKVGGGGTLPSTTINIVEEDWNVRTPDFIAAKFLKWNGEDDIVPQPTFHPEEDYWFQLKPDINEVTVIVWPGTEAGGGGSSPGITTFVPEEDYWYQSKTDINEIVLVNWPVTGVAGGAAATLIPLNIEEEDWKVWTPPLIKALPLYLPDPEQVPAGNLVAQQYGSQSFSAVNQRATSLTEFVNWWQSDDLPLFIPINVEEEDWKVKTPPFVDARPLYLPDPEQVPANLVAPPLIEEEDWKVWTPPLVAANRLYLPEPEGAVITTTPSAPPNLGRLFIILDTGELGWIL